MQTSGLDRPREERTCCCLSIRVSDTLRDCRGIDPKITSLFVCSRDPCQMPHNVSVIQLKFIREVPVTQRRIIGTKHLNDHAVARREYEVREGRTVRRDNDSGIAEQGCLLRDC